MKKIYKELKDRLGTKKRPVVVGKYSSQVVWGYEGDVDGIEDYVHNALSCNVYY